MYHQQLDLATATRTPVDFRTASFQIIRNASEYGHCHGSTINHQPNFSAKSELPHSVSHLQ